MARKHRVKANDTYDTVAAQYGVGVDTVLNMNPGVISPKGGTYLNVPSAAETSQGAFGFGGGGWGNFIGGAADLFGGAIDAFNNGITAVQNFDPNFTTARPVRNPSGGAGNATYLNSERAYAPVRKTNGSVSSGGDGGGFGTPPTVGLGVQPAQQNSVYTNSERESYSSGYTAEGVITSLTNGDPQPYISPQAAADLLANGVTPEAMAEDGYYPDGQGGYRLSGGYNPKNPSGNAGGWFQQSDGSWKLNQNGAQQRKAAERKAKEKKARESGASGATQTQVATWSIG